MTAPSDDTTARPSLRWIRSFGWLLVAATTVALGVMYVVTRPPAPPTGLPIYGEVPAFELQATDGRSVSQNELAGKPYVADFVFTRCQGTCPVLSRKMAGLQDRLPAPGVARLVSFSVDPDHDTPEVLRDYAASHGAGPDWLFLTGDREAIYDLIRRGFLLGVSRAEEGPTAAAEPIVHSTRFVLVDAEGQIRGYYEAFEPERLDQLVADLQSLL